MATYCSILAWIIPWTEEPGGLQSMGSQSWTQLKRLSTNHCSYEKYRISFLQASSPNILSTNQNMALFYYMLILKTPYLIQHCFINIEFTVNGLPRWLSGKESACQWRRHRRHQFNPWRRKWQPTPVFLPGKSHGQRSLEGYSPQGYKEQTWLLDQARTHAKPTAQ